MPIVVFARITASKNSLDTKIERTTQSALVSSLIIRVDPRSSLSLGDPRNSLSLMDDPRSSLSPGDPRNSLSLLNDPRSSLSLDDEFDCDCV